MASTVINLGLINDNGYMVIQSTVNPLLSDFNYKIGTKWINTVSNEIFEITNNTVNFATWLKTSNEAGTGEYITTIVDPFNEATWNGNQDTSNAKTIKWYISMSNNSSVLPASSSSSILFEVDVQNDELSQNFTVSSTESGTETGGCNVRVVFPASGVANLECIVSDSDWRVMIKRLDF